MTKIKEPVFHDSVGRYVCAGLFLEMQDTNNYAIYTSKRRDVEQDGVLYPSLYRIYMNYDHTPGFEYDFANDYLDGWTHWLKLCEVVQCQKMVKSWRDELEIKIKSSNLKQIISATFSENPNISFNANKWLADKGWKDKEMKGRPTKAMIEREAKISAGVQDEVADDLQRIRVINIKG